MKKIVKLILGVCILVPHFSAIAQRNIAEATITYNITIQAGNNSNQNTNALNGASTTIYLKGNNSRTDNISALGKEITIFNSKTGNAVILKEFSGQKLMITLTNENWKEKNEIYKDTKFEVTDEYKMIGGFNTRKAIAKMSNGKTLEVYYSPELIPANKDYDATFKNLPGLPLQYEIETGKMRFKYTIEKIDYDPVPVSMFDFPSSGYRMMTYEENQNLKKGN